MAQNLSYCKFALGLEIFNIIVSVFPYFCETKLINCWIFLISAFYCFLSCFKAAGIAEALTPVRGEFAYANFTPLIKSRST